jgi:hypothetical protein
MQAAEIGHAFGTPQVERITPNLPLHGGPASYPCYHGYPGLACQMLEDFSGKAGVANGPGEVIAHNLAWIGHTAACNDSV